MVEEVLGKKHILNLSAGQCLRKTWSKEIKIMEHCLSIQLSGYFKIYFGVNVHHPK